MTPDPGGILLYDGECGFCQDSVRLFHRLARRPVRTEPAARHFDRLSEADRARSDREILFLTPDGSVLGGIEAIAAALKAAGRPSLAWLLSRAPFAQTVYAAFARRRRRLTCAPVRPGSSTPLSSNQPEKSRGAAGQ